MQDEMKHNGEMYEGANVRYICNMKTRSYVSIYSCVTGIGAIQVT